LRDFVNHVPILDLSEFDKMRRMSKDVYVKILAGLTVCASVCGRKYAKLSPVPS
jgi:hypothetical protein